jgi:1-acyl-sn-glycerol-3-phosphate acyltransferase
MSRAFYILMFKITGWKIVGGMPENEKKFVLIVAPHTSFWDFPVGLSTRAILRLNTKFLGKKELFKNPLVGTILKWMGGIPVDRGNRSNGIVDSVVKHFNQNEEFVVTITPEGTRAYAKRWKTGFYRIAKEAKVPIVMVGFDFERKIVEMCEPFYPTEDMDKDMENILEYFRSMIGKNPELGVK